MSTLRSPNVDVSALQALLAARRELSDREISVMLRTVSPLVRRSDGLYHIEPVDPRAAVSFIWEPRLTRKAGALRQLRQINTLHGYGFQGFFKPSIAEVLCMIPRELVSQVKAFEVFGPQDKQDLRRQWPAVSAGYHVATTVLYA